MDTGDGLRGESMDRLISEQVVLETIATWVKTSEPYDRNGWLTPRYLYDRIKTIPTAEPCEDAISRQAAIKSIEERAKQIKNEDTLNGLAGAVAILFELPSVKPQEPKTGHWKFRYDANAHYGWYECDHCHTERPFNTDYCPDCGAKMVEPQESEE